MEFCVPMKQAIDEYCLRPGDFQGLPFLRREQSSLISGSTPGLPSVKLYSAEDCLNVAIKKYGSLEKLEEMKLEWISTRKSPHGIVRNSPVMSVLEALTPTPNTKVQKKRRTDRKKISSARKLVFDVNCIGGTDANICEDTAEGTVSSRKSLHSETEGDLKSPKRRKRISSSEVKNSTSIVKKKYAAKKRTRPIEERCLNESLANEKSDKEQKVKKKQRKGIRSDNDNDKLHLKCISKDRDKNEKHNQSTAIYGSKQKRVQVEDEVDFYSGKPSEMNRDGTDICSCSWTEATAAFHILIDETRSYIRDHKQHSNQHLSFGEKLMLEKLLELTADKIRHVSQEILLNKTLATKAKDASNHCEKLRQSAIETRSLVLAAEQEYRKLRVEENNLKKKVECLERSNNVTDLLKKLANSLYH